MKNWIDTTNPFGLAKPPQSFLVDLFTYDSALVLFPSQAEPVFRLCRRVSGAHPWQKLPAGHHDNPICIKHRLVPLKAVQPVGTQWGQILIANLAATDTQRHGGGKAFAELLDQQEELESRRLDVRIADEAEARAADAYKLVGYIGGTRVALNHKVPEGGGYRKNPFASAPSKKKRVFRPRASGEHAIFVGR
jgi:hypothetical protein